MSKQPPLGPTGKFPAGKLAPEDQGELRIGMKVHEGRVVLGFGKEIAWIGMDPDLAEQMGRKLIELARRARPQIVVVPE